VFSDTISIMADFSKETRTSVFNGDKTEPGDLERRSQDASDIVVGDHGADTNLKRQLTTRHVTMIGLGSSIGMGLWIGSGASLARGGPASLFLGYCLAGSVVWCVTHSIGEMAVMYPQPSAFVQWAGKLMRLSLGALVRCSSG
jgi:yeast amino acid transporter